MQTQMFQSPVGARSPAAAATASPSIRPNRRTLDERFPHLAFTLRSAERPYLEVLLTSERRAGAELTSEVDLRFMSDYFPLQRFAPDGTIERIRGNTAAPGANMPSIDAIGRVPSDEPVTPSRHAWPERPSTMRPIGTLPPARRPLSPENVAELPPPPAEDESPPRDAGDEGTGRETEAQVEDET